LQFNKNKSISEAELDHKQTQVYSSQNKIETLHFEIAQQALNINRCAIQAPFDGVSLNV
jgi:multidrug resistance efflux pump